MSVFRQDRTNGSWVIVAPERGRRPRQWSHGHTAVEPSPGFDPSCPFCPGNERLLPEIIDEIRCDHPPGWRSRVVPNKFPALRPDTVAGSSIASDGAAKPGFGYHEVIIETGRHDGDLATFEAPDLAAILECYRRRYAALAARPGIEAVLVFRNFGRRAGASLAHPHAQVIASGLMPPRLAATAAWARAHHARHDQCVTCAEIDREIDAGDRVVETTARFLVIVPYAATNPFEQRILPRRHQPSFAEASDEDLAELGLVLQRALRRMSIALESPPYNFFIESISDSRTSRVYLHWGLHIVPDIVTPGGFELGAGLPINPSLPEDDAAALRSIEPKKPVRQP